MFLNSVGRKKELDTNQSAFCRAPTLFSKIARCKRSDLIVSFAQNSGFLLLISFPKIHRSNVFKQNACRYTTVFSIIALQLKLPVKAKKKEFHGFHVFKMFKQQTSNKLDFYNFISLNQTLKNTRFALRTLDTLKSTYSFYDLYHFEY